MTPTELQVIEERWTKTTPGEWVQDSDGSVVAFPHGKEILVAPEMPKLKQEGEASSSAAATDTPGLATGLIPTKHSCNFEKADDRRQDCFPQFMPEGISLTPEIIEMLKKEGFTGPLAENIPRYVRMHVIAPTEGGSAPPRLEDGAFIAAAHQDVPSLLEALRAAELGARAHKELADIHAETIQLQTKAIEELQAEVDQLRARL